MRKRKHNPEEILIMISMINDDMPFYEFNMLKHNIIVQIDKSKRAKRKRKPQQ